MAYSVNTTPLLQDLDSEDDQVTEGFSRDDKPLFKAVEPRDSYNMGYLIFYLLGITTLLPWNFYVTANDVSMFVFSISIIVQEKFAVINFKEINT